MNTTTKLALALATIPSLLARADVLFQDNFNSYTDGNLVGQGPWIQRDAGAAGSPRVTVASGAIALANTGQDAVAPSTGTTYTFNTGNIPPLADPFTFYMAADVTVSVARTGDYILHTSTTTTSSSFASRLYIRSAPDGTFNFGTGVTSATPAYAPNLFSLNTPYRVVVRYDVVGGASNDVSSLYAFPVASVPATEPATPLVSITQSGSGDASGLGTVNLRQGGTGSGATAGVDNIILATTFLEASGAPAPVVLTWNPATTNVWNTSNTNWLRGSVSATFANGDDVAFTDTGVALNNTITIDDGVRAGFVSINSTTINYLLDGRDLVATGIDLVGPTVLNTTDSSIILDYTGTSAITNLIEYLNAGQLVPSPDANGLPTTLAIAEAADLGLTTFNGIAVDDTTVIAKYTYVGDANLDGQVDALDYERIDLAIGNTGVFGTAQGDLNYDGNVDALDYEQVDLNIGNGVGMPLGTLEGARFIPEPTLLAPVALAALAVSRRSRR